MSLFKKQVTRPEIEQRLASLEARQTELLAQREQAEARLAGALAVGDDPGAAMAELEKLAAEERSLPTAISLVKDEILNFDEAEARQEHAKQAELLNGYTDALDAGRDKILSAIQAFYGAEAKARHDAGPVASGGEVLHDPDKSFLAAFERSLTTRLHNLAVELKSGIDMRLNSRLQLARQKRNPIPVKTAADLGHAFPLNPYKTSESAAAGPNLIDAALKTEGE